MSFFAFKSPTKCPVVEFFVGKLSFNELSYSAILLNRNLHVPEICFPVYNLYVYILMGKYDLTNIRLFFHAHDY